MPTTTIPTENSRLFVFGADSRPARQRTPECAPEVMLNGKWVPLYDLWQWMHEAQECDEGEWQEAMEAWGPKEPKSSHETKDFDESKHPRGQPGNAGQFGSGGSSTGKHEDERYQNSRQVPSHKPKVKPTVDVPKADVQPANKAKAVFGHVARFAKALAKAPEKVRDVAHQKVVAADNAVDATADRLLKALPPDVADTVKESVRDAVFSTVQEQILGCSFADVKQNVPWDWTGDMAAKLGPWAVCRAMFGICKKFATDFCKKFGKAIPDPTNPYGIFGEKKSLPEGIDAKVIDAAVKEGKSLARTLLEQQEYDGDIDAVVEKVGVGIRSKLTKGE